MPDKTRNELPPAKPDELRRADIGDDQYAEVDPSERGQNFAPRRGEDVRDNVPHRYPAQGNSKWGRGEPGEEAVRRAAEEEARHPPPPPVHPELESVPFDDTEFERQTDRAKRGDPDAHAFVDASSEENQRATRVGQVRPDSPVAKASCRRAPGKPK